MNQTIIYAAALSIVFFAGSVSAELKKLRSWPAAVMAPDPAIKKQYEYDPAAAAVSPKMISIVYDYAGSTSTIVSVNYKNSEPISGTSSWNEYVMAYHGFLGLFSSSNFKTTLIKFASNGPWPANQFKLYHEYKDAKNTVSKSATACKKLAEVSAQKLFPELPGKIYRYQCSVSYGSVSNNFTYAPDAVISKHYYSDYLDLLIFVDNELPIPVINGKEMYAIIDFNYIGPDGNTKKLKLSNKDSRSIFSSSF